MTSNQTKFKTCARCKQTLPVSKFHKNKSRVDGLQNCCVPCILEYNRRCYRKKPRTQHLHNKTCSTFLGITVAEQVLSKVFKDVEIMPPNNPGYDFICNHGKNIDVKSSCLHKNTWNFSIKRNKIADFFLCIAFDDRESLNPLHLWLIPGYIINTQAGASVSKSTIHKWSEYKLDISKTLACCTSLK